MLDKQLRSASKSFLLGARSHKPQLTVKPYENPPKLIPKLSIKHSLTQKPDKNVDGKQSEFRGNDKPAIVNDSDGMSFRISKKIQSQSITANTLIENDQTKASYASNGVTDNEQNIQPNVSQNNQSDEMETNSSSTKRPTEQRPSSKLSTEQRPLSVDRDEQQALNVPVIDLDESDADTYFCQNDLPDQVPEKRQPTETHPNTLEQATQLEPVNMKSTTLNRREKLLSELHPQTVPIGKSKEPNYNHKNHHQILSSPPTVSRPPSAPNQPPQQFHHQSPILSVINHSNLKSPTQKITRKNFTETAHNIQRPRSYNFVDHLPSTSCDTTWQKVPSLSTPVARRQASAAMKPKTPANKKTRLENMTKNISTLQYPPNSMIQLSLPNGSVIMQAPLSAHNQLQPTQLDGSVVNINPNDPNLVGIMNPSASQNLFKLAHQYHTFISPSHDQKYLPAQEDHLQQFARIQDMLDRKAMVQPIDQRVYNQNSMMNGGFLFSSQPHPINQPIQFLPLNGNHYVPVNKACSQEVMGHGQLRDPIYGVNSTYKSTVQNEVNCQPAARTPPNQSHRYSEHSQQNHDQPNRQDPRTASIHDHQSLASKRRHCHDESERVTKRLRSISKSKSPQLLSIQKNILLKELGLQRKVKSPADNNSLNPAAVSENLAAEQKTTTQDSEAQRMPLADEPQSYETQSTSVHNNDVYQHHHMQKNLVEQATETESTMNVDQYLGMITESIGSESALKVVESVNQTNKWLDEDEGSPFEQTSSDSDAAVEQDNAAVEQDIESENDDVLEDNSMNLTNEKDVILDDQHTKTTTVFDEEMLDLFETLFNQMGANLSYIRDMYNFLRSSIVVCNQTYDAMLERINKINLAAVSQSELQVTQLTQVTLTRDNNDDTSVRNDTKPISDKRGTFSLPEEYDPNDTSWTRKYQELKPGLVELLPKSGVYVNKKELKRCIRESSDCRSLARSLLTEVFSKNALSVCSLTGGKAKAFKSVNIDVRPGLDKHARIVLVAFVESHGIKRGWAPDTFGVISSIRTKINDIRAKHVKKNNF